jgi:hypothetical protein
MRKSTIIKYRAIQNKYQELYNQGLRTDVIIPKLMNIFYYQHPESVWRVIRTPLPEEQAASTA